VRKDRSKGSVDIDYLDGPFRRLHNAWLFEPQPDGGCTVDFEIDFEFKNRLLGFAMDRVFGEAVARMVAAFEKRARKLYSVQAK
jgi:coenzyme Q-binding protein COQ10